MSAENSIEPNNAISDEIQIDFDRARALWRQGDQKQASEILLALQTKAKAALLTKWEADIFRELGVLHFSTDPDRSYFYFSTAYQLYTDLDLIADAARTCGSRANLLRVQGNFTEAYEDYSEALRLLPLQDEPMNRMYVAGNFAGFLYEQDRPEEAEPYIRLAIDLAKQLSDKEGEAIYSISLAKELHRAGRTEDSWFVMHQAEEVAKLVHSPSLRASIEETIGFLYYSEDNYPEAESHWNSIIDFFKTTENNRMTSVLLMNLGICRQHAGDLTKAKQLLEEAIEMDRIIGDRRQEAIVMVAYASVLREMKELEQSYHLLHEAIEVFRSLNYHAREAKTMVDLANTIFKMGDVGEANWILDRAIKYFRKNPVEGRLSNALLLKIAFLLEQNEYVLVGELAEEIKRTHPNQKSRIELVNLALADLFCHLSSWKQSGPKEPVIEAFRQILTVIDENHIGSDYRIGRSIQTTRKALIKAGIDPELLPLPPQIVGDL